MFVPFRIMFGDDMPTDVPIVQVSMDSSLSPSDNWAIGKAVTALRCEIIGHAVRLTLLLMSMFGLT